MKYEILFQDLIIQLRNRISQNSKLVTKLVDILSLEKEAVYRRLRQEVPFSFEEMVTISKEFNISLDSMLGVDARTTLPFRFQSDANGDPVAIDYKMLEEYLKAIKGLAADPAGEIASISNLLPHMLYCGFKFISHFYYFKWRYYSIPGHQTKSYHDIVFPEQLIQISEAIFIYSKKVKNSYYILDNQTFQNFANDVSYFNSIRLLKDEDLLCIKKELFRFLDYLESVATKGFVDNPSNKVFIYISETSIDTSYSCFDSQFSFRYALIWSFIFNSVLTFNEETLKMMKRRIQSIIRTSILLSVAGEKQRTEYFEAQRKIVGEIK